MPEKTRLAICGLGLVGVRHVAAALQLESVEFVAAADPSTEAKKKAGEFGLPVCDTLDQLFQDHAFDGLILATPTPLHAPQAIQAIKAGCPLLIEKPIATQAEEARGFVEQAEASSVPILIGHHRRHNPLIQAAKAAIDEGVIGDIKSAQSLCWFYKPNAYFDAAPWRKEVGAGPISVNLVHDVDLLRHLCGDVVSLVASKVPSQRGYENEELASALLTFENGALGTLSVSDSIVSPWSWEMTSKEYPIYPVTGQSCYQIGGSLGALSIPDLTLWRHEGKPDWWTSMQQEVLNRQDADPLVLQLQHFCDLIQRRCQPLVSGREGLKSLQVIEAIARSADTGERISL